MQIKNRCNNNNCIISVYRSCFAITAIFIGYGSILLLNLEWNFSRTDEVTEKEEITNRDIQQEEPIKKKRGTYKIITNYLEAGWWSKIPLFELGTHTVIKCKILALYCISLGEGAEGLDWELCMTEDGETAILQYPYYICVSNRLSTLPADFVNDLVEVP